MSEKSDENKNTDDSVEICWQISTESSGSHPAAGSCSEQLPAAGCARTRGALKLRPTQSQCVVPLLSRK